MVMARKGGAASKMVYTPERIKAIRRQRSRDRRRWAARSGPVTVRRVEPVENTSSEGHRSSI